MMCYDKIYLPLLTEPDLTDKMENDMKEVDPKSTSRALAFELWMKAPMPMVTLMKTLDVTALVRMSRKKGYKFNMLLCWCIGKAAEQTKDFYLLPVGDKLMQYDRLAINTVVATRDGGIATCDIPVSTDLEQFAQDYRKLTGQVRESGENFELGEEYMVIGTSALAGYEIDGAVNIYAGVLQQSPSSSGASTGRSGCAPPCRCPFSSTTPRWTASPPQNFWSGCSRRSVIKNESPMLCFVQRITQYGRFYVCCRFVCRKPFCSIPTVIAAIPPQITALEAAESGSI